MTAVDPFIGGALFALGLTFGSFLNVCIYRLPRDLSVVRPGSACPKCGSGIRFYDNVPVVSWLLLAGRCRRCKASITPRYLIVELLTGAIFLACYASFGLTIAMVKYCIFGFLLLGLIFTDAETQLLPDKLTLPGLVIGLLFSVLVPVRDLASQLLPWLIPQTMHIDLPWRCLSFADSVLSAAVGASFIYGIGAVWFRVRGIDAMGFGDVKLMAMVGAFLGVRLTMFTMFAASISGSLFGIATVAVVWVKRARRRMVRRHEPAAVAFRHASHSAHAVLSRYPVPFGVFLGSMAMLALFFGERLLGWYWGRL
jgi:leader peptidase (prepilin peptidase)/N-methyltransferase